MDRLIQGSDHIYFPVVQPIDANTVDDGYWLYYGASNPGAAPADRARIFTPRLDANTTGLWYFDEGVGTTTQNLVPGGAAVANLGEPNAAYWSWSRFTDRRGISLGNQQNSVYPTIGHYAGLRPDDMTVEVYLAHPSADSGDGYIIQKGIPGKAYALVLKQSSSLIAVQLSKDGGSWWSLQSTLPISNYYLSTTGVVHIAFTYESNSGRTRLFANGQKIAEGNAPFTGPLYGGSDYAQLGSPYPGPQYFSRYGGLISALRISNVARTSFPYAAVAPANDPGAAIAVEESHPDLPTPTSTPPPPPEPPFWGDGSDGNHTVSGTEYTDDVRSSLGASGQMGSSILSVSNPNGFQAGDEILSLIHISEPTRPY